MPLTIKNINARVGPGLTRDFKGSVAQSPLNRHPLDTLEERPWILAHLIRVIKHPGRQGIPQVWRYKI
jgi:hypothetical protein